MFFCNKSLEYVTCAYESNQNLYIYYSKYSNKYDLERQRSTCSLRSLLRLRVVVSNVRRSSKSSGFDHQKIKSIRIVRRTTITRIAGVRAACVEFVLCISIIFCGINKKYSVLLWSLYVCPVDSLFLMESVRMDTTIKST
jgi:hypothetical protein